MSIDMNTPQFQVAFTTAVQQAKTRYEDMASHARIARAIALVLTGHVCLKNGTAEVQSQADPGIVYVVAHGTCSCPSVLHAGEVACKHQFAVWLLRKALAIVPTIPEPLCWIADWYTGGRAVRGVAHEFSGADGFFWFIPDDGAEPRWTVESATVLSDLTERSQFVAGMRAAVVTPCEAF